MGSKEPPTLVFHPLLPDPTSPFSPDPPCSRVSLQLKNKVGDRHSTLQRAPQPGGCEGPSVLLIHDPPPPGPFCNQRGCAVYNGIPPVTSASPPHL